MVLSFSILSKLQVLDYEVFVRDLLDTSVSHPK